MPMLDALVKHVPEGREAPDLSDVVAVVVRYFGGVLLGAGGLVRAYSEAVSATLARASFATRARLALFTLEAPVAEAGRWEHELRAAGIEVVDTTYDTSAHLRLAIDDTEAARAALDGRIATITSGAARAVAEGTEWRTTRG
jgi:putative IMPACT (imprinted ancient) family translation regulator